MRELQSVGALGGRGKGGGGDGVGGGGDGNGGGGDGEGGGGEGGDGMEGGSDDEDDGGATGKAGAVGEHSPHVNGHLRRHFCLPHLLSFWTHVLSSYRFWQCPGGNDGGDWARVNASVSAQHSQTSILCG